MDHFSFCLNLRSWKLVVCFLDEAGFWRTMAHNSGKCYILLEQHALSIWQSVYFSCLSFTGISRMCSQFLGVSAKTEVSPYLFVSSFRSLICWWENWVHHLMLSLEQQVLLLWACCWNPPIYVMWKSPDIGKSRWRSCTVFVLAMASSVLYPFFLL